MAAQNPFRAPRCWELQENITVTDFAKWKSCLLFHLASANSYSQFIEPTFTWQKSSTLNRGLVSDADTVDANERKTAVQKNAILEQMLGLIAQYTPALLRNDVIKKSTSLSWIWNRVRQHYGFQQSEVHFLNIHKIKPVTGERPETLYQRLVSHVYDNLLTANCNVTYDGQRVTADEELSATGERLIVYMWLDLIDPRLPAYIGRVYAHDLQTKSLKDIQPQISLAMDSLLAELNSQEESQINYSKSASQRTNKQWGGKPRQQFQRSMTPKQQNSSQSNQQKQCMLCKSAGRTYLGHNINDCWFISKFDRLEMSRTLQVSVEEEDDEFEPPEEIDQHSVHVATTSSAASNDIVCPEADMRRVSCSTSPFIFTFYRHFPCKILIDTGATSSMVSLAFVKRAGLTIYPANQGARQLDKSTVSVKGECKFEVSFGHLSLKINALITDVLDCDVLAGCPFGMDNDVVVHLRAQKISIMGETFPYGANLPAPASIRMAESVILRNDSSKVLYPGEYVEIHDNSLMEYEGDVSIEPRIDSPLHGSWPSPTISRVIQGSVRIPNDTEEPIHLSRSKHFAQIRRVTTPVKSMDPPIIVQTPPVDNISKEPFSRSILLDPDNQLTSSEKEGFHQLHLAYDNVFNKSFGTYNGASGPYKASIGLGPIEPPSTKPMLPMYPKSNMQLLQQEADKLEALGILARPEDLGIEVKVCSPSFLRKKPDGTYRFVTAFNELGHYSNVLPTAAPTSNDVLRHLSSFQHIIKTDLTKAFFQIPMDKASIPYLGTITPFKGIRVYTRSAMGQPGSSEHLRELLTRVVGDYLTEGFLIIKDDDMYIGSQTIQELLQFWQKVLQRLQLNNLYLSAGKTEIAPKRTTVLGWIWECGTISIPSHKIIPLANSDPPKTCRSMRSFIGAYKAISRCIPNYSSLMSPMENCIKGLDGNNVIPWDSALTANFRNAQKALAKPHVLTIPTRSDKLSMTVDASPLNDGISASLFVTRDGKKLIADNFSLKLKTHQTGWQPCELEALAITAGVKHFSPYIRESEHPLIVFTDSKPCVEARNKLLRGHFSASARISTFLSCLSEHNLILSHIKGTDNTISDFGSRHPSNCSESSCQICKFVEDLVESVVRSVSVNDVLSGSVRMPFMNKNAWMSAQRECHELRRTVAHLRAGTRPSRKSRGMRNVKRYLKIASIDDSGLLVVFKPDQYLHQRKLIVVPKDILPGVLHALHLYFSHCTESQLLKLFHRQFYCIGSDPMIKSVTDSCNQCTSLKKIPKELFEQSSTASPTTIGQKFSADVIKRKGQCIFSLRDVHSSYTTATIVPDETGPSMRSAIVSCSSYLRGPSCSVRVDNAPGLITLKGDVMLRKYGIELDFGNVKNINKNPCGEKCNQELELELLKIDHTGSAVSDTTLQSAVHVLNSRIRNRGLSSKEIVTCRDQATGKLLNIDDNALSQEQEEIRKRNQKSSARSKAPHGSPASVPMVSEGTLIYLKAEGNKFTPRDPYIIISIEGDNATIQKIRGSSFMSRKYTVPLDQLYPVNPFASPVPTCDDNNVSDDSSDEDYDLSSLSRDPTPPVDASSSSGDNSAEEEGSPLQTSSLAQRPVRQKRLPAWLGGEEWEK